MIENLSIEMNYRPTQEFLDNEDFIIEYCDEHDILVEEFVDFVPLVEDDGEWYVYVSLNDEGRNFINETTS